MELKDFVKNTILDIMNGVKEAQDADTSGAMIIPPLHGNYGRNETLRFDIAIEELNKDSGGGKIGVSVGGLVTVDGGGENAIDKTESSRVQFEIQVRFPSGI